MNYKKHEYLQSRQGMRDPQNRINCKKGRKQKECGLMEVKIREKFR